MQHIYIYIVLIILFFCNIGFSQQDAQVAQYMQNKAIVNPAAAGIDGGNFTLFYRNQWTSLPGSPKTFGAIADVAFKSTGVGLGINIINTTQGSLSFTRIITNYSYKIKLSEDVTALYLGLQAGAVQYIVSPKYLITHDPLSEDVTLGANNLRRIVPDFGFGAMFKHKSYYLGVAMPHMLQPKIKFINSVVDVNTQPRSSFAKIFRHYYVTAGGDITINKSVVLQPSVLLKMIANAPITADINLNATISEKFWGGLGYRASQPGGIIFMAGVNIKTLKLGYAYEITNSPLSSLVGATHEILINYQFAGKPEVRQSKKPYFLK